MIGEEVDGVDFEGVVAGGEGRKREVTLDGDLFTGLLELFGGFVLLPDLLVVLQDAIRDGDVRFVGLGVELEVVELKEDAHFVGRREFGIDARADFVGVEDEGALADLARGDGADLVGEDEGAGVEGFFFVEGNAEGGVDYAYVAALRIFEDDV